jgi:hypothetical protein
MDKFDCSTCDYHTLKKNDYIKHLLTAKHIRTSGMLTTDECNANQYMCFCGKAYKHQSTLCTHKKKCTYESSVESESTADPMMEIINQNKEFKELIMEQQKQLMQQNQTFLEFASNSRTTTIQQTTNVNNTFNLQLFLNIDCKDALSMEDFLKTVVVQLKDLEHTQIMGYSDGVSSIIVNALKALEINKRPIHCSDLKRKTMYIKEGGEWLKEHEDNARMKVMIRNVGCKTIKKIPDWVKEHPQCVKGYHKDSTPYLQMIQQVSGGDLKKEDENIIKIINTIAKEVIIAK